MKRMSLLLIVLLATDAYAAKPRQAPPIPQAPRSTVCDCASTGKCLCWAGQCTCEACKPAKAVPAKAPFARRGTDTTKDTPALIRSAFTQAQQAKELGFSEATSGETTYTIVPSVVQGGCTNGSCQSTTSVTRRRR